MTQQIQEDSARFPGFNLDFWIFGIMLDEFKTGVALKLWNLGFFGMHLGYIQDFILDNAGFENGLKETVYCLYAI